MALHKPFDRTFTVLGGTTMTQGRSLKLVKGQFGIFDVNSVNKDGAKAVSSFKGQPKNKMYQLKLGDTKLTPTRSQNNKSYSSFPFELNNVLDLKVSAPERVEQSVDEVILGYNGIDDSTALSFKRGDSYKIYLELSGESIGMLGYTKNKVTIPVYLDAESCSSLQNCVDCDPCESVEALPIVLQAIEILKDHKLRGNVSLTDFVEITPIKECNNAASITETPYDFYCLEVCDTGDANALALVQEQYPDVKVERTGRNGAISSYQFIQPQATAAPSDFSQTLPSLIKGCEDCPTGYTEVEGGLIYAVTLEDDGADLSTTVETLAGAVAGTAIKADAQNDGVGYYTVVLGAQLTDANLDTFVTANPTATIDFVGEAQAICTNATVTTVAWAQCGTCNVSEKTYSITLPDTECGENRLTELQEAFPDLNVIIAQEDDGAGGTQDVTGGCQTKYSATVQTNLVCDECDPIFRDYYNAEAPEAYDLREWVEEVDPNNVDSDCNTGIRVKGKVLEVHPDECLRDEIGFIDNSVKVRISGGHVTEVREGIGETEDSPFNVEYLSRYIRRTHLGGKLWDDEDRNRVFFTGEARHVGDNVAKLLQGEESNLRGDAQYVDYALTLRRNTYTQSFGSRSEDTVTFHILVEVGRHAGVENLLNSLAAGAGIKTVQAFGN